LHVQRILIALVSTSFLAACGGGDASVKATKRAQAAIATMKMKLRQRLQAAMANGPAHAVEVCANEAQTIRKQVAEETGVTLGRASLRLRTEADAAPDWVAEWLKQQGERKVEGVAGFVTAEGDVARVLEPIGLEPACVNCHGAAETLGAEVKAALAKRYPTDAAVGYQAGDLRGAFWAELRY
jgi:hypothetical protein